MTGYVMLKAGLGNLMNSIVANAAVSILLFLSVATPLRAQTNWVGTNGSWFTPSNWNPSSVPTGGPVVLDNGGTVHVSNASATAGDLYTGYLGPAPVTTLIIENGGDLGVAGSFLVGRSQTDGHVSVGGAGSRISSAYEMLVGTGPAGSMTIANGGAVTCQYADLGTYGTGSVDISGAGSILNVSAQLIVGEYSGGIGTLNLLNGGNINVTGPFDMLIGNDGGAVGTVVVSGSQVNVNRALGLGLNGGSSGTLRVTGANSTWTNTSVVVVGNQGSGTLEVLSGGAVTIGSNFNVANSAGSTGSATISGASSTLTANAVDPIIGAGGNGTVLVDQGGDFVSAPTTVGFNAGSQGTVTVTAPNSSWSVPTVEIGHSGTGTLNVLAGGAVHVSGSLTAGLGSDSTGYVTVSGAGSQITAGLGVAVGTDGPATLTIADGGVFSDPSNAIVLGNGAGGAGQLNLNGTPGSRGVLYTTAVLEGSGVGSIGFNGGTFRASSNGVNILSGFGSSGVTINAGGAFFDSNGLSVSIPVTLAGTGTLTKMGSGTLTLTATNLQSGGCTVEAGTLVGSTLGSLVNNTPYVVNAGTLDLNAWPLSMSSLSGSGGSILTNNALTLNQAANTAFAGGITGNGGFIKTGAGTLTLTGSSNHSGGTTIKQGSILLSAGGAIDNTNGNLVVGDTNAASLQVNGGGFLRNNTATIATTASSVGTVTITGGAWNNGPSLVVGDGGVGILNLDGGGTIVGNGTGTVTLARLASSSGALNIGNGSSLGTLSAGTVTGGAGVASVTFSPDAAPFQFNPNLTGSLSVTQSGPGTTSLFGNNSYSGSTTVTAGTLRAGVPGALPSGAYKVNGGTLDMNSLPLTITSFSGSGGAVALGSSILTVNQSATTSYAGAISGTGSLDKEGSGVLTLSGANSFSGAAFLGAGVLAVSADANLGGPAASLSFYGGTLRATSGFTMNRPALINTSATFDVTSGTLTQQSSITGPGSLTKIGAGTLILGGTNSYGGITTVDGGTLSIPAGVTVTTGGVHVADASGTSGGIDVAGTLNAGAFMSVGDNLPGVGTGGTGTLNINNGGTVSLSTGAKLTVGWVNANGTANLNTGGLLQVGGTDGIQKHPSGTAAFNLAGGTVRVTNSTLTSNLPMSLSNSASTIDTNGFDATFSGGLTGTGAVTKAGAGTLTLTGINTYSGGTILNAGTLLRGLSSAFPNNTPYSVNGGILNIGGSALTASSLSGTGGTISINNTTFTVDQATDTSFAGGMSGSTGAFRKQGVGTLVLSGASSYSGGNLVGGGTLIVNGSLPGPMIVMPGATLGGSGIVNGPTQIQSGATLAPGTSPGQFTVGGLVSLEGTLRIDIIGATLGTGYDQFVVTTGDVTLTSTANLSFGTLSGVFPPTAHLFILSNTGTGATTGTFNGLPDDGATGTPVPALDNFAGYSQWRIYYHADAATNALVGGNDIALSPVFVPCTCPGDVNGDGTKDGRDVQGFVNCVLSGGNCSCADLDLSGTPDINDVQLFMGVLIAGNSCP